MLVGYRCMLTHSALNVGSGFPNSALHVGNTRHLTNCGFAWALLSFFKANKLNWVCLSFLKFLKSCLPPFFEKMPVFHWLVWSSMANKPRETTFLELPRARAVSLCYYIWLFIGVLWIKHRTPWYHSKCFNVRVICSAWNEVLKILNYNFMCVQVHVCIHTSACT